MSEAHCLHTFAGGGSVCIHCGERAVSCAVGVERRGASKGGLGDLVEGRYGRFGKRCPTPECRDKPGYCHACPCAAYIEAKEGVTIPRADR